MTNLGTQHGGDPKPGDDVVEPDPRPQTAPTVPQEDEPEIEETEEKPS